MMKKRLSFNNSLKKATLVFFTVLLTFISQAQNQFFGAEISYIYVENNTYEFTVKYFVKCGSENFDKLDKLEVRCMENNETTDIISKLKGKSVRSHTKFCGPLIEACKHEGIDEIEIHEFVFQINFDESELQQYQNCGRVRVTAEVCCRDSLLIGDDANDVLSVYAEMDLVLAPGNSSPKFSVEPEFYISCISGAMMSLNAIDHVEDDSISYQISYRNNFTHEGIFLNKENGDLYLYQLPCDDRIPITIEAREWRRIPQLQPDGSEKLVLTQVGIIRREIQIMTIKVNNFHPSIAGRLNVIAKELEKICIDIETDDRRYIDYASGRFGKMDTVKLWWDESILDAYWRIKNNSAIHPEAEFCWIPPKGSARHQPYFFNIIARDNACPINATTSRVATITVLEEKSNIYHIKKEGIKCYPNPANHQITIESIYPNETKGAILNIQGQEILQFDLIGKKSLDISSLPSGVYFINLDNTVYQKFVKY